MGILMNQKFHYYFKWILGSVMKLSKTYFHRCFINEKSSY
jgi:hypothetical protein